MTVSGPSKCRRSWRFRKFVVFVFSALQLLALTATAEPVQEAKALFEIGAQAYSVGDYDTAVEAFSEAYRRAARPGLLFSLGQAHRRAYQQTKTREHLYAAVENYRNYLGEVQKGGRRREAAQALLELELLTRRLDSPSSPGTEQAVPQARLMIACRAKDAVLSVDGQIAPRLPYIASVPPGRHQIAITAKGHEPYEQTIEAPPTGIVALNVELKELPALLAIGGPQGAEVLVDGGFVGWLPLQLLKLEAGPHRISVRENGYELSSRDLVLERGVTHRLSFELETTTQRKVARVFLIGGMAGLATAAGLGTVAFLQDREARRVSDKWKDTGSISEAELNDYNTARDTRGVFRNASVITASASAAVGIAGLLLYFTDYPEQPAPFSREQSPSTPRTDPALDFATPTVGPGEVGLDLSYRF